MQSLLAAILSLGILVGCNSIPKETESPFAGLYAMTKGGFNECLNIELNRDGTYTLDHEMLYDVIGPNGEMTIHNGREQGIWKFDGDVLLLDPKARAEGFLTEPVFAPAFARRLLLKKEGTISFFVSAYSPDRFVFKRTDKRSSLFSSDEATP